MTSGSPRTMVSGNQIGMPAPAAAALAAYVLVTIGSCLRGDVLLILGVPLTIAGFAVAWIPAAGGWTPRIEWPVSRIALALSALAAVGLASPSMNGARWFETAERIYFALAIVLIGVFAGADSAGRRRATNVLAAGAVALQIAAPLGIRPVVDVWSWTETCTRALLHGVHPYTVHAADLSLGGLDYGSTPTVYPYMPLTLLASAPWVALLGDYRFGLACCLPATLAMVRAAGRRLDIDAAIVDVITLALALHPLAPAITGTGYIEPFLVAVSAGFVLSAVVAPGRYGEGIGWLLLPAIKQYVAAPVLLYVAMRGRPRTIAIGAAVAAATVAPFLVWNWRPTIDGILFFGRTPLGFRVDSDSAAAIAAAVTGVEAPPALSIAAQFAVAALAYRRLHDRGLAGLLLASALSMLASFLVAPQAFTNYYYFAGALLVLSALAAARPPGSG
jgi:uncharacterized membrane protein YhaH (DUF805 family)